MKTSHCFTSACRCCGYYKSEGRRGGMCELLGANVQAHWKACALATNPFTASPWENLDIVRLENAFSLEDAQKNHLHDQERILTAQESHTV